MIVFVKGGDENDTEEVEEDEEKEDSEKRGSFRFLVYKSFVYECASWSCSEVDEIKDSLELMLLDSPSSSSPSCAFEKLDMDMDREEEFKDALDKSEDDAFEFT